MFGFVYWSRLDSENNMTSLSHFDEKSGFVVAKTPWGEWYQTVNEICILVHLNEPVRGKDIKVVIKPSNLECTVQGKLIFKAIETNYN